MPKRIGERRSLLSGELADWRVKALVQRVFSALPGGERLNYLVQRYVAKSLPVSDAAFVAAVSYAKKHMEGLRRHFNRSLHNATFYEFGAGWDMIIPLAYYGLGIDKQIIVDLRNLIRPSLVNGTIDKYQRMARELDVARVPNIHLNCPRSQLAATFTKYYGIDYRAPCDARQTGLEAGSIDCITSTSTLEHIPLEDIQSILQECDRILSADGLMSFHIDYLDHYSYFDSRISRYNYLKYSDTAWALFNSALHYQNRLRHRDYLDLFRASGFEVVEEQCAEGTEADLKTIAGLSLAKRFRSFSLVDLAVSCGRIVLRKRTKRQR